jgi:hypothetical protein
MTETVDVASGEVAVRTPAEVLASGALPAEQVEIVEQFLSGALPDGDQDPAAASLAIIAQVLSAETPEEVLTDLEAEGLRQHLEEPFRLESVEFRRSDYEVGMPFYALMRGVDVDTGDAVLYTSGSQKVTAQLFRLVTRGWLPRTVVARQSKKPTAAGYFPVRLVDVRE